MYKAGEEERPRYDNKFDAGKLRTWVARQAVPLVIRPDTPAGSKALQKLGRATPRLVVAADKASPELVQQLQALSKANEDLAVVLATEQRQLDNYGLTLDCTCKQELLIEDPKEGAKYLQSGASVADASGFIKRYQEGKLERYVRSEEPPADNNGPVFVLTAKTFNETVFKGDRDFFIEFYAPWCGHCQRLAPAFEAVGKKLQDANDDGVVLAKFDCTTNDEPSHAKLVVHGYPTMYFVTATGDVYSYDGDRSEKDLYKFITYRRTTEPGPLPSKAADAGKQAGAELKNEDSKEEL
jgi:protein disulfide isomerase